MTLASVYRSAKFERRDELNSYRSELENAGVEVTSRWLTDPMRAASDDAWAALAQRDFEDVKRAEGFVFFADGIPSAGGRHVEFGIALGLSKRIVVVGATENLFQRLPYIAAVATWEEAFKLVTT